MKNSKGNDAIGIFLPTYSSSELFKLGIRSTRLQYKTREYARNSSEVGGVVVFISCVSRWLSLLSRFSPIFLHFRYSLRLAAAFFCHPAQPQPIRPSAQRHALDLVWFVPLPAILFQTPLSLPSLHSIRSLTVSISLSVVSHSSVPRTFVFAIYEILWTRTSSKPFSSSAFTFQSSSWSSTFSVSLYMLRVLKLYFSYSLNPHRPPIFSWSSKLLCSSFQSCFIWTSLASSPSWAFPSLLFSYYAISFSNIVLLFSTWIYFELFISENEFLPFLPFCLTSVCLTFLLRAESVTLEQ